MLCNKCGKNQATVHYKQVINGKQTELYLCPECAASIKALDFGDFLPNLFGHVMKPRTQPAAVCPKCGMPLSKLAKVGKIGCAECYSIYEEYLIPALKRIHGGINHTGKVPAKYGKAIAKESELQNLKKRRLR